MRQGEVLETMPRAGIEALFEDMDGVRQHELAVRSLSWAIPEEKAIRITRADTVVSEYARISSKSGIRSLRRVHSKEYGMPVFFIDLARTYDTGDVQVITSAWYSPEPSAETVEHREEFAGRFLFIRPDELKEDATPQGIFKLYDEYNRMTRVGMQSIGRGYALDVRPSIFTADGVSKLTADLIHRQPLPSNTTG